MVAPSSRSGESSTERTTRTSTMAVSMARGAEPGPSCVRLCENVCVFLCLCVCVCVGGGVARHCCIAMGGKEGVCATLGFAGSGVAGVPVEKRAARGQIGIDARQERLVDGAILWCYAMLCTSPPALAHGDDGLREVRGQVLGQAWGGGGGG